MILDSISPQVLKQLPQPDSISSITIAGASAGLIQVDHLFFLRSLCCLLRRSFGFCGKLATKNAPSCCFGCYESSLYLYNVGLPKRWELFQGLRLRGEGLYSRCGGGREGGLKCACLASLESARFGAWVLKRETTSPS